MTASRQDNARNHNDTPGGPTPIVMKAMNKVSTAIKTAKRISLSRRSFMVLVKMDDDSSLRGTSIQIVM
jgi:hypothetical protein